MQYLIRINNLESTPISSILPTNTKIRAANLIVIYNNTHFMVLKDKYYMVEQNVIHELKDLIKVMVPYMEEYNKLLDHFIDVDRSKSKQDKNTESLIRGLKREITEFEKKTNN